MEWSAPDGTLNSASFDDALDQARSQPAAADRPLARGRVAAHGAARGGRPGSTQIREVQPDGRRARHRHRPGPRPGHRRPAARPVRHRGHRRHLRRPATRRRASPRFAAGPTPWLVAVRMVSEGVDIPRLRVGVYATTTTTELFFRQAVGRFVRWTPGRAEPEGVPVHPRRPAAAGPGLPDRRAAPPLAPQAGAGALRAGPDGARPGAARSSCRCSRRSPRWRPTTRPTTRSTATTSTTTSIRRSTTTRRSCSTLAPPPPLAGDRRSPAISASSSAGRRRPHPARGEAAAAGPERRDRRRAGPPHRSDPCPGQPRAEPPRRHRPGHRGHGRPAAPPPRGRRAAGPPLAAASGLRPVAGLVSRRRGPCGGCRSWPGAR